MAVSVPDLGFSEQERQLLALVENPRMFGEAFLVNRDRSPRRYRPYQVEDLECHDSKIVHLDGRAVGKSIDLGTLLLWFCFTHPGKSVLVAAPYQGHLDSIVEEVEHQIDASDVVRESIARNSKGYLKIVRKPYYEINFTNSAIAYFRPAGATGAAFRSLHVDFLLVDEAAWLPEAAWKALRQCLNEGGQFRVYSTPNGLRDTTYYRLTQSKDWRVFRWPSWIAPDWTPERERDLLEFYGGRDTPGWQHEVAGEHGKPAYGAFNQVMVARAMTDVADYRLVNLTAEALQGCVAEDEIRERVEMLLNLGGGHGMFWLGGDLGYTSDPTELVLFEEDDKGVLTLRLRIHAEHIPYPVITEVIALIDRVYGPVGIGIDRGGNGMSVVQELTGLDKFRDLHLAGRLVGYDFGGSLAVGEDDRGQPIRKRTKEVMTNLVTDLLNRRGLLLPKADTVVEDQFCTQTYTLTDNGVVYSKGNDHVLDAIRCAVLRRAQERSELFEHVEVIALAAPVRLQRELP